MQRQLQVTLVVHILEGHRAIARSLMVQPIVSSATYGLTSFLIVLVKVEAL